MNVPQIMSLDAGREIISRVPFSSHRVKVQNIQAVYEGGRLGMVVDDQVFAAQSKPVLKEICSTLGIDIDALAEYRDSSNLVHSMIRHSLDRRATKEITVVTSGDQVHEVLPENRGWCDPIQVFDMIAEAGKNRIIGLDAQYGIREDETKRTFRFVTDQTAAPLKQVDDVSHAGIYVSTNGQLTTGAFCYRLACTNGMLRSRDVITHQRIIDRKDDLRVLVERQLDDAFKMVNEFVGQHGVSEDDPVNFLSGLTRGNRVNDRNSRLLTDSLNELPSTPSRYDLINLITSRAIAHNDEKFEWLGASAVDMYTNQYRWERVEVEGKQ